MAEHDETTVRPSVYRFRAADSDGRVDKGTVRAVSRDDAERALRARGLYVLELDPAPWTQIDVASLFRRSGQPPKMKRRLVAELVGQLNQYLRNDFTLPAALEQMSRSVDRDDLQSMFSDMSSRLMAGEPVGDVFERYERSWGEIVVHYVRAAEASGTMVETTQRLKAALDQRVRLDRRVARTTTYPIAVTALAAVLVVVVLLFIVPRFEAIYDSLGAELPAPTRAVIWLSSQLPWIVSVTVAAIAVTVWWVRKRTREDVHFGELVDRLRWRIPGLGKMLKLQALFRWSSTLAGALAAGLPIGQAFQLAGRASRSSWLMRVSDDIERVVRRGERVQPVIDAEEDLFPMIAASLLGSGEATGSLEESSDRIAEITSEDVGDTVERVSSLLEVGMLVVLGGAVGAIVITLYLPILQLATTTAETFG